MSILLTGGNVNDCAMFTQVMAGIEFHQPGPGKTATSYRSMIDLATLLIWL